jgi:hypothetical protein
MRTRLLLAAVCILTLPIWFSPVTDNKLTNSTPFTTVAIAGHVPISNAYCDCGTPNCICDPGESPMSTRRNNRATSDTTNRGVSSTGETPATGFNFGAGAMLLALAVFAWTRFRM